MPTSKQIGAAVHSAEVLGDSDRETARALADYTDEAIIQSFTLPNHAPDRLRVVDEHGRRWVECLDCGAQWSVEECSGARLDFEEVSNGDGWCDEGEDCEDESGET